MDKVALRQDMRWRLGQIEPEERAAASELIRQFILASECWQNAATILLYAPLPGEPDIYPLLPLALQQGKLVYYPKIVGTEFHVHQITDPTQFKTGAFGVTEPDESSCPRCANPASLDLALVPGLAFDTRGGRLGRGRGYYDRFLTDFSGWSIGCFFHTQLVESVPLEAHDRLLPLLVTEQGLVLVNSAG